MKFPQSFAKTFFLFVGPAFLYWFSRDAKV